VLNELYALCVEPVALCRCIDATSMTLNALLCCSDLSLSHFLPLPLRSRGNPNFCHADILINFDPIAVT